MYMHLEEPLWQLQRFFHLWANISNIHSPNLTLAPHYIHSLYVCGIGTYTYVCFFTCSVSLPLWLEELKKHRIGSFVNLWALCGWLAFLSYKSKRSHSNFVLLVPDFTISVYCNSYNYLFLSHSLFFSTSIFWPPSCNALGMPLHRNIEREQRSENEEEKDIITWTAVHRNCKIRDYLVKAYDPYFSFY